MSKTKSEKEFSKLIQNKLSNQYLVHSFENSSNQSVPDLYLVRKRYGESIWVEVKIERAGESNVSFMPGQVKWLEDHGKAGGLSLVLLLTQSGRVELYTGAGIRRLSATKNCNCHRNPSYRFPVTDQSGWNCLLEFLAGLIEGNWPRF